LQIFGRAFVGFMLPLALWACMNHDPLSPVGPGPNHVPQIKAVQANPNTVTTDGSAIVSVEAEDADGDSLIFRWQASAGTINGNASSVTWKAPSQPGEQTISVEVRDTRGDKASATVKVMVITPPPQNQAPVIASIVTTKDTLLIGTSATITVQASDADGDALTYTWSKTGGELAASGASATWTAPRTIGIFYVTVSVTDGKGGVATRTVQLVVFSNNNAPQIKQVTATPASIRVGESTSLRAEASDPDNNPLTYTWTALGGTISGSGPTVKWTAPSGPPCCAPGDYVIKVKVEDGQGGVAEGAVTVKVTL
jgi:hypothetical protein